MRENELDLRGLKCPLPALKVRKALRGMEAGDVIVVTCTDPLSALDIPNLLRETGDILAGRRDGEGTLVFTIRRA